MKKEIVVNYSEGEGEEQVDFTGKVSISRINAGMHNSIEEEASTITFVGDSSQFKISSSKLKELSVLRSVAGWNVNKTTYVLDKTLNKLVPLVQIVPLDLDGIRGLPTEVFTALWNEYVALNAITGRKKEPSA
jgi:hypothetical protein